MIFQRKQYLNRIIAHKHNKLIKIITGIRRCGKSFLLFTLFKQHLLDSGVKASHIIEIPLDDREYKELRNDAGVVTMGLQQFLLDENSLDL